MELDSLLKEQNKFLVNNQIITITDEEKITIYNDLINNNIPPYRKIIAICMQRLIKGTYPFKKEKDEKQLKIHK